MKKIKGLSSRIGREFNPEKIILFGSYAYGSPSPDSDVDILIIMNFDGRAVDKSVEMRLKFRPSFPLDLIIRTPAKVKERLDMGDFFIREAITKGIVLYEADHKGMDSKG